MWMNDRLWHISVSLRDLRSTFQAALHQSHYICVVCMDLVVVLIITNFLIISWYSVCWKNVSVVGQIIINRECKVLLPTSNLPKATLHLRPPSVFYFCYHYYHWLLYMSSCLLFPGHQGAWERHFVIKETAKWVSLFWYHLTGRDCVL